MVQKGQIIDVRKFLSSNKALSLSPYYKRIFLPNAEKALTKCLLEISDSGMKIGKKKIISQAKSFFCIPWVLTERVTYQIFSCSQKKVYVDDKNEAYTEEFIKFAVLL